MLLAVAALLFQFPVFSPYKIQAAEKVNQPAAVAKAAADSVVSSKSESSASPGKEVLNAESLSLDAEASVAFAPGRVVAEPVAPGSSAPATPPPAPASPGAVAAAAVVAAYGPRQCRPNRADSAP